MTKNNTKQQVLTALSAARNKKAEDIAILELGKESSAFTDYFLICSGGNPRQVQAIADEVDELLSRDGFEPNHREGYDQAEWVLLDYFDFVVHIFSTKARGFYDLERLWKSAKRVDENELRPAAAKPLAKKTATKKTAAKKAASKKVAVRPSAAKPKVVAAKRTRTTAKKQPAGRRAR